MTFDEYNIRLDIVERYLSKNLDQCFDMKTLAQVAGLSPYHWHRVYVATRGETILSKFLRMRLSYAAEQLAHSDVPIDQIARKVGFSTLDSFSSAFKGEYSVSPVHWRKGGSYAMFQESISFLDAGSFNIAIQFQPPCRFACLEHHGSYMQIGETMGKLLQILETKDSLASSWEPTGFFYSDPSIVPTEKLRSLAGVSISDDMMLPVGVDEHWAPSGQYAILRYQGPYDDMKTAYQWLYGFWLPNSGFKVSNHPVQERYLNSPADVSPSDLLTDIVIGIQPW